jgi:SWI/SNF-related matrix-associated actin-dependent regulator of chromatin subfamily D
MDGLEVKRRGDQNVDLKIMLFLDTLPEKHKLSPQLSKLLDMHTETLSSVIMALWQYIKSNRLQDADDRRIIICDEKLQQIFGMPKIMFPNIPELLARHLFPADPVILNYTVRYISLTRVDKLYHFNSQAFDIQVPILDPVREKLAQANVGNPTINREIQALDDKIAAVVQTINLAKLKRDFMHGFVEDPVKFINQWIASQSRDLEVFLID